MLDRFNAIIIYTVQHQELANAFHSFLFDYVFGFRFVTMRPEKCTVYNRDICTNNYLESFHAALLNLIPKYGSSSV